jgi:hypothetical protein
MSTPRSRPIIAYFRDTHWKRNGASWSSSSTSTSPKSQIVKHHPFRHPVWLQRLLEDTNSSWSTLLGHHNGSHILSEICSYANIAVDPCTCCSILNDEVVSFCCFNHRFMGTTTPIDQHKILPAEIPMSMIMADYFDEEKIIQWDLNVSVSLSGGHGNKQGGVSSAWPVYPVDYMVVTSRGFYANDFKFLWTDHIDGPNRYHGYVGRRKVKHAAHGSPNSPRKFLQFIDATWDDEGGWRRTASLYVPSNPDLNEAFHKAINDRMSQRSRKTG